MSSNECASRLRQGSRSQSFQESGRLSVQNANGQSVPDGTPSEVFVGVQEFTGNSQKALLDGSDAEWGSAAIESLMNLQFAESFPVVMERARKNAQTMLIQDAIQQIKTPLSTEVLSLLNIGGNITKKSDPNLAFPTPSGAKSASISGLTSEPVFIKAMGFINTQFKTAREKMDIKLFECGFFKIETENNLADTMDDLAEAAQDIGLTQAVISKASSQIEELGHDIEHQRELLANHLKQCDILRKEYEAEKAYIQENLRVIELILSVTEKDCKADVQKPFLIQACLSSNGKTRWQMTNDEIRKHASDLKSPSAQKAFEGMLSEIFAMDEIDKNGFSGQSPAIFAEDGDEVDDDDIRGMQSAGLLDTGSFAQLSKLGRIGANATLFAAAPDAGTPSQASNDAMNERCSYGVKPDCGDLIEKIGQLKGETLDDLDAANAKLDSHNRECNSVTVDKNEEIAENNKMMTVMNTEMAKASGTLSNLQISHGQYLVLKHDLCQAIRTKYGECYAELKTLESEMCGLMKVRQAVYAKVKQKPGDSIFMIQDCEMGDWVVGPCSTTCLDQSGHPGVQVMTREELTSYDPKTPEGKYGVSCPPSQVTRDCANKHCPIDCQVGQWSGWSKCTAGCGGGQQSRSRNEVVNAEYEGATCPAITDVQACGSDACDADCELGEWGPWSPCSRSCKWKYNAEPGKQIRKKPILVALKGNGKCPMPHTKERTDWRYCNNEVCATDIKCVADLDVTLLIDGSGSLLDRTGPPDSNWQRSKTLATELIEASQMATVDPESGQARDGMRYGVVLFASGAHMVSSLTHKTDVLKKKIEEMKWPRTMTYTDRALRQAIDIFQFGSLKRKQVVLLLTDGRATNRKKAEESARAVREKGIRLIIISVKGQIDYEREMCLWTTHPCTENLMRVSSYKNLVPKLRWYLSTLCPVLQSESSTTKLT